MASKEKILVVDDEPSIRKYLQTLLEVDGYEVETVGSGREAIEKVAHLLDRFSPRADGFHLIAIHLQQGLEVFPNARFVVYHQDFFFRSHTLVPFCPRNLALVHWQQERKPAAGWRFTLHPNLSAMGLDQPLRNREP